MTHSPLKAQQAETESREQLPTAFGPDTSEDVNLKVKTLAGAEQTSMEERRMDGADSNKERKHEQR